MIDLLVPGFYDNYETFMHRVDIDHTSFKPMGTKMGQYELHDCTYEFYHCTLSTSRFKQYHRRLQLFLMWFIEGSSYIDEDDDKWEILLLYSLRISDILDLRKS